MMAEGSPQYRLLRFALFEPVGEALALLQRVQSNEMFQRYLRERRLYALPLAAALVVAALALAWGALSFIGRAGTFLSVLTAVVLALCVLAGSLLVQAYVALSWLEGRSLAKLQEHRRARERGPAAQWVAQRFGIDLGPLPRVPWVPAAVLFVLPALMLASVAPAILAGLAAFYLAAAAIYAKRDPVAGERRASAAPAPSATPPLPKIEVAAGAGDLDFSASTGQRFGVGLGRRIQSIADSFRRSIRSAQQSGQRGVRFIVQLCLLNLPPFIEYCALASGLLVAWAGWAAGGRDLALGVALVGGALLIGGLASIVTKRMSFRFHLNPQAGYAGAWSIVAGVMQLIAGGLAGLAAHALATNAWQARVQAVQANPWLLLVPVSVLLICLGLLLMRPLADRAGALGMVLFVVPKTVIGFAALAGGVAILGGLGWQIYDPQGLQAFLGVAPEEYMKVLAGGWKGQ